MKRELYPPRGGCSIIALIMIAVVFVLLAFDITLIILA